MEVDKRVFDFFCFLSVPSSHIAVNQKRQGHSLSAHVTSSGSRGAVQGSGRREGLN